MTFLSFSLCLDRKFWPVQRSPSRFAGRETTREQLKRKLQYYFTTLLVFAVVLVSVSVFSSSVKRGLRELGVTLPSLWLFGECASVKWSRMQKALTKVSSFRISIPERAKKEIASIGDDLTTFTSTVEGGAKWVFNKLKGKESKPLPELLREFGLPEGLFPKNVTTYDFDESRNKLIVYLPSICEVSFKDSSVIRYSKRVSAFLLRGKMTGIEGMKTKVVIWVKISTVSVDSPKSNKVHFTAGVTKTRPKDAYDTARVGVPVEEF